MSVTDSPVSERAYRWLFIGVVLYFLLVAYSATAGEPLAMYSAIASAVLFGAIAIGMGVVLYRESDGDPSPLLGAAACLFVGGVLQFVFLATGLFVVDQAASLAVFAGVGLYLYTVWVQ
ncbi:hypothetical protein [Halobiforma nitratireducens]|uniref:Uncharacterized protein n=1 Tax=Halobiforma nitratireducens JCM 10879 TaxID=1227454 RepID=M0M900_9EURY|nr:hypothetical protein [Halobiforma nitratireducens]EMA41823.1 hypothetical protein C446_05890 [Halobiforma nitratireducens JCM 10879]